MKIELPEIGPDERTPLVETLLGLLRQLRDRVAELERRHQELPDENARLKGQKEGIAISSGQLPCILTENQDHFHKEKAEALGAGLTTATYIDADDTGARHQGKNGFTTALGNDLFAYFETTDNKSRLPRLADLIRQKAQEAAAKKPTAPSPSEASEAAAPTTVAVAV
jgi:hypothetical protein